MEVSPSGERINTTQIDRRITFVGEPPTRRVSTVEGVAPTKGVAPQLSVAPQSKGVRRSPSRRALLPESKGVAPQSEGVAPRVEARCSPVEGRCSPVEGGCSPVEGNVAPSVKGVAPQSKGFVPSQRGVAPQSSVPILTQLKGSSARRHRLVSTHRAERQALPDQGAPDEPRPRRLRAVDRQPSGWRRRGEEAHHRAAERPHPGRALLLRARPGRGAAQLRRPSRPFLYATNGEVTWFHDVRHTLNRSRRVADFHTATALAEMLGRDFDADCDRLVDSRTPTTCSALPEGRQRRRREGHRRPEAEPARGDGHGHGQDVHAGEPDLPAHEGRRGQTGALPRGPAGALGAGRPGVLGVRGRAGQEVRPGVRGLLLALPGRRLRRRRQVRRQGAPAEVPDGSAARVRLRLRLHDPEEPKRGRPEADRGAALGRTLADGRADPRWSMGRGSLDGRPGVVSADL